jgi:transcriptional regulator with XRE-family HTH domain
MAGKRKSPQRPKPKRRKPARLAAKLFHIRIQLGLSQGELIRHLGFQDKIERDYISKYERGILEPTLDVLLAYARACSTTGSGEYLEAIVDDKMDLPDKLPSPAKRSGSQR